MRLALTLFLCLLGAAVYADEKVQEAEGKVAPDASASQQAARSEARKEEAEWIRRCDKLKKTERMSCLEQVRAQMVQRLGEGTKAPAASE